MTDLLDRINTDLCILQGDVHAMLRMVKTGSMHCVVTSPPYWKLRDYGFPGQLGLEATPQEFIRNLVKVFRKVRRVLRDDGTLWVNMGDSYINTTVQQQSYRRDKASVNPSGKAIRLPKGFKVKDKALIPHRLAIALQDDGWYVRQDIVWHKRNPMPETVFDRPTTNHEYFFLLSKSANYYYDADSISELVSSNSNERLAKSAQANGSVTGDPTPIRNTFFPAGWATGADRANDAVEHNTAKHRVKAHGTFPERLQVLGDRRNKRSVWPVQTSPLDMVLCNTCKHIYSAEQHRQLDTRDKSPICNCGDSSNWLSHFAAFGPEWIEPAILAGCPPGGTVLDIFAGTGTTGGVALAHGRKAILIEGSADYVHLIPHRVEQVMRKLLDAPAPPPVCVNQTAMKF